MSKFVMTYSYGRALQQSALKHWAKDIKDIEGTQKIFDHRANMCSLASMGKWVEEVDKENYRIMWWARYLLTRGEHSWKVEKGETENTSILISEETFKGPRAFLAIGVWLFRFFDVDGMTDKQLSFIAMDAEQVEKNN